MRTRSPQEKKELSYARDCRNCYGENDKASRRNLPRKRARWHRLGRRAMRRLLQLPPGPGAADQADAEALDIRARQAQQVHTRAQVSYRKSPDRPLREHVRARRRTGSARG